MTLKSGTRVGPYQILAAIGAGGMGEVYRAHDTKLGRDVALKTLHEAFASDGERLARFRREAHVLAALNHANIAAIYGLEESADTIAIILELVDGETLADRINSGPIPVDEAVPLAKQIAEALEAAHEKDVLHRDLKPANIKISHGGIVKVLDFGLAKVLDASRGAEAFSNSPTIMSATGAGVILGTAAYMSPEQARGKATDKRTDIWAFGVVLFEMLTGKPTFSGETVTDVLGAIVHQDPDWEALPPKTPAAIRRVLRRCLVKDPRQRLHDIADARIEMEAVSTEKSIEDPPAASARGLPKRAWLFASILVLGIAAVTFLIGRWAGGSSQEGTTLQTDILPPVLPFQAPPAPALSPDGRTIAFNAPNAEGKTFLWFRPLDSREARPLPGTEGSVESFWSPDSRSLAFVASGKLQRVDIAGGLPQFLAAAPFFEGGSWGKDGTILFVPTATDVYRIPASGGSPKAVTKLNAERHELIHGWPSFLPDGKHFVLWVFSSDRQNEGIYVGAIDSGELRPLLRYRSRAQYSNGYLFFGFQGNLLAQKFDPDKLQLSGEPKRLASGLSWSLSDMADVAFSVSDSNTVVWSDHLTFPKSQPTWFSRTGEASGTLGEAGAYFGVAPSPDGKYVATEFLDFSAQTADILLWDLVGGNPARLTFVNYWAGNPVWSADSQRLIFTQWRDYLDVVPIRGGSAGRVPFPGGTNSDFPMSWSPDGQNLLVLRSTQTTGSDLWIVPITGDHKPQPYLNTPVNEFDGRISPDGRWVAYTTDESGRNEVLVQSFPTPGNKKRVSVNGGSAPAWRKDGRELFYITEDHAVMSVSVTPRAESLDFSPPTRLFVNKDISSGLQNGARWTYAPSPDGQRFLVLIPVEIAGLDGLHLIHNWKP